MQSDQIGLTTLLASELQSAKIKSRSPSNCSASEAVSPAKVFTGREGLGAYLEHPASFPPERVIYHTEKWVVINDLYPKAAIHVLLLPRDKSKNLLHPSESLSDPSFLADVQAEVRKVRALVAKELQRRYGKFSAQDQARVKAMDADVPPDKLPPGRDWEADVISGIHAHPSMSHLHIHVLSIDRLGACMKKWHHYNSFATPFLIGVEDYPLAEDDPRRHPGRAGYLKREMRCWRCGKKFGKNFEKLKGHLAEEFERWKRA